MNARDELAEKVFDLMVSAENMGEERRHVIAQGIAAGLESAGWSKRRTITTEAELDALPELSVVIVGNDLAVQKDVVWYPAGGGDPVTFGQEAWDGGVVVLFTPGGE